MRTSELTHRIVVQRSTEARDAFGDPIATWTNLAQVWAQVVWSSGSEAFDSGRDYAEVPVRVRVRRSTDSMTFREKDRVLVPLGVTELTEVLATTADTTAVVKDAGVFPPENNYDVRVGSELMTVTGVSSNTLTVTRGAYSSTAAKHAMGASVIHMARCDVVSARPDGKRTIELTCVRSEVGV